MGELKQEELKEHYSVSEYFAIANAYEGRVEYLNGTIKYMAGGSFNHSRLSTRITTQFTIALNGKDCEAFNSDLKVFIDKKNSYLLPDASIICGKANFSDKDKNAVTNPIVIVEVLSKSTSAYDLHEKFSIYRSIPSLQEYVLIDQSKQSVEVFTKKEGIDIWQIKTYETGSFQLESVDISISLQELYKDIDFSS